MRPDNVDSYCRYGKANYIDIFKANSNKVWDIEDLRKEGFNQTFCPFYYSKKIKDLIDVLFLPYNYLLELRND